MKTYLVAIIAVAVGILGFFVGMYYEKGTNGFRNGPTNGSGQANGSGQFNNSMMRGNRNGNEFNTPGKMGQNTNGRMMGQGFRPVVGTVISKDDKSVTVKMDDGSSKIVLVGNSTVYSKTTQASSNDVSVGTIVGIIGSTNTDGSVSAQNIQIDPSFGRAQVTPTSITTPRK